MGSRDVGSEEMGDASRFGPDVTCREFVEFLDDYVSGVLSKAERAAFNAHLAACPSCVAYMKTYQASVRAGKTVFATTGNESVPAEVPEELVRAVVAACRRP